MLYQIKALNKIVIIYTHEQRIFNKTYLRDSPKASRMKVNDGSADT